MKLKGIRHKTVLTEGEEVLFQALVSLKGYREEMIFPTALRLLHKKEFPPYAQKKKGEPGPSAAEQCIADGGEIIIKDNINQCRIRNGALEEFRVL